MRVLRFWIVVALVTAASPVAAQRAPADSGDFRTGDRILLSVEGEPQLTDTFTVVPGPAINLPVIGTVLLAGVRRAQLEPYLVSQIGKYVQRPVVHASSMVRVGILGEVARPGFYALPSRALLDDAIMAAGGVTQTARIDGAYLARLDGPKMSTDSLRAAIAHSLTIAQLGVHSGDELVVPRQHDFERTARVIGILITIPAAIFAFTRFR